MNFVDGSFHELKLLFGGAGDHKHHPYRQNETLRFMTHAFPPMSSLSIEHLSRDFLFDPENGSIVRPNPLLRCWLQGLILFLTHWVEASAKSISLSKPHKWWRWRHHRRTYARLKKEMWVDMFRAILPFHLRTMAQAGRKVTLEVEGLGYLGRPKNKT
jgi:hypothetical protein